LSARAVSPRSTRQRARRDESRQVIAGLQARYADDSGIKSLKIKHNNVLGYFVDVTAQHGEKLMSAPLKRDLHPPADHRRPGALHHNRARRA
jgi:DNA mismatch repair ATPase MutS